MKSLGAISRRSDVVALVLILSALTFVFWPVLLTNQTFVYRDAGHYYFPLYKYIADEWKAGRTPLWNPYDNLGQPLLANGTSAVFYPGKLIFAFPFDYATNYNLYIVIHSILAASTCYVCVRHWGIGEHGAEMQRSLEVKPTVILFLKL